MDLSKFKTSDWLKIGGGLAFFVFGTFFDWAKLEFEGFAEVSGGSAWDFFFTGIVPMLLLVGTAVVTVLLIQGILKPGQLPWPLVQLAAAALGALLVVLRFLVGPGDGLSRGVGLILAAIAAIVVAAGAFLGFQESGGNVKDLTDVDKLKGAFGTSGGSAGTSSMAPPPPPPAPPAPPSTPPPPPPSA